MYVAITLQDLFLIISTVEGVKERMKFEEAVSQPKGVSAQDLHAHASSRRRKGSFLCFVISTFVLNALVQARLSCLQNMTSFRQAWHSW